jgi:hypothetical protein
MIRWRTLFYISLVSTAFSVATATSGAPPKVISWWELVVFSALLTGMAYLLAQYEDGER